MAFPPPPDMPAAATMKALRFHARKDIRIDTVPVPAVGPGQVRLAPKFCGICGSDLHEYLDGPILMPAADRRHPISKEGLPLTMGHEFSGVVQEVGDGVAGISAGDRVCVLPLMYDGDCRACLRGLVNCCDSRGVVGVSGWGGGLSESVVLPAACIKKLPDGIPLEVGALVEPLAVGWHAVDCSPPAVGHYTALVLGAGPIGLAVVQALVGRGCGRIIVSEVSTRRSEFALTFGAHHAINPARESMSARVAEITGGAMADIAYDAAGVAVAVEPAFDSLNVRGTMVNIAVWGRDLPVPMNKISFREIRYTGVSTYTSKDFDQVIEAITAGRIVPAGMITKMIRFDRVVEDGFDALIDDKENQIKIMIDMEAERRSEPEVADGGQGESFRLGVES